MLNYLVTANQLKNSQTWGLKMHKNSLHIVPVLAIPQISLTPKLQKNSSDTLLNTSTGHHWKWSQPASKLQPLEISLDKSYATEASAFKNSANVTLIQRRISALYGEQPDSKTPETDKTA
jgi:hypothetical protein